MEDYTKKMSSLKQLATESTWHAYAATIIVALALLYLYNTSQLYFAQGNTLAGSSLMGIAGIFIFFILMGITAKLLYRTGDFGRVSAPDFFYSTNGFVNSLSFLTGIIGFTLLTGGAFSVIGFNATQSVYSTASTYLTEFWQVFVIGIAAPICEELFFLIGGTLGVFAIVGLLARQNRGFAWLDAYWIKAAIAGSITALTFAWFHVGQAGNWSFFYAALIFRLVLLGLAFTERFNKNLIPFIDVTFIFAVAAHMANNWNSLGGITHVLSVLSTDVVGWFVLLFFALNVLFVVYPIANYGFNLRRLTA